MNKEIRVFNQDLQLRSVEDNGEMILEGYAIVFNSPATYDYTEIISNIALDNTDMSDVVLRYNHNDTFLILARTKNKSLELFKDEKGLKFRAKLIPTISEHRNVYEAIKAQLIDKCSFAFSVKEAKWDFDTNTRTITNIGKLYDVSVVDQPFYDSTSLYARSLEQANSEYKNKKTLSYFKNLLKEKIG